MVGLLFGTSLQTAYFSPSTCLYVPLFKIEVAFLFVDLHTTVTDKEIHFETDGFYVMSKDILTTEICYVTFFWWSGFITFFWKLFVDVVILVGLP
jgi:hypothetical protein